METLCKRLSFLIAYDLDVPGKWLEQMYALSACSAGDTSAMPELPDMEQNT